MEFCGAFHNRIFLFVCACFSGILFALVWRKYEETVELTFVHNHHYMVALRNTNYDLWLKSQNLAQEVMSEEDLSYSFENKQKTESAFLYRKVPVLCLIFVNSHNGATAVKETWSKHCNIVTFFGHFVDNSIPVMKVPPVTSFEGFCYAFMHVWHKYKGQFEWMLIADDYTYALIDNLRYYVAPLNSSMNYYLGHPVKDFSSIYNVGSAGIVLSHGSLNLLYSLYKNANDCVKKKSPSWYFDESIGKIFETFSVHPVDTRDTYDRSRFNLFSVETMLIPGSISVFSSYWRTSLFLSKEGMDCCSDKAITYHGLIPSKMFLMEYIFYHLAVYRNSFKGIGNGPAKDTSNVISPLKKQISAHVGEPFVQLLENQQKKKSKETSKSFIQNIWNDLF